MQLWTFSATLALLASHAVALPQQPVVPNPQGQDDTDNGGGGANALDPEKCQALYASNKTPLVIGTGEKTSLDGCWDIQPCFENPKKPCFTPHYGVR